MTENIEDNTLINLNRIPENFEVYDLTEWGINFDSFKSIGEPKNNIAEAIKRGLEKEDISIRKLAESLSMQHPQIIRITKSQNYNIDTLLKILDRLNLELIVKEKNK